MAIETGKKAPDFCLNDKDGNKICLNDFSGKWLVLYFYPKDNTSGCTKEAIEFSDKITDFDKKNCVIVGVSPDSEKSHINFTNKHDLKVQLLSDPEHKVLEEYEAWGLKKMYGREYYGVIRSTVLIDPDGIIRDKWTKVRVKGHVDKVFDSLIELM